MKGRLDVILACRAAMLVVDIVSSAYKIL